MGFDVDPKPPLPQYELTEQAATASAATPRAVISSIEPESAAWDAGLDAGMVLTHVNGVPLTDMIEWQWQADGSEVEVTLDTGDVAYLERDLGQDWGITFDDCLFDRVKTCCNNCTFCFMTMLPRGMRKALYVRDDDYRLSFLQGNFVTLTNVTEQDFEKIVSRHLSPLHVSVHAIDDDVRRNLMGRNAHRGKEMLKRLLEAGIQVHTQLVLVPHENDGAQLVKTLSWLESYPGVLSVGIVPLGYTKFQDRFTESYSEDPAAAAEVISIVRAFQEKSRHSAHVTRYHISDEFYLAAKEDFPPAKFYDGFPQFHDGIGMMRTFIDDWNGAQGKIEKTAALLCERHLRATIITGTAFANVLAPLISSSPLARFIEILPVENGFFGGNVDVSGLLTASDIVPALLDAGCSGTVLLPREAFNSDMLTLDDATAADVAAQTACDIKVCTYSVDCILETLSWGTIKS